MDGPWFKRALAGAVALVVAVILLLLAWPRTAASPDRGPDPPDAPVRGARVTAAAGTATQDPDAPALAEQDADLAGATPQCKTIVKWHRRNVAAWVIEDNMMAQGMKFDDADLACLTAGGVPPQILDFAEQNTKRPQPPVPQ